MSTLTIQLPGHPPVSHVLRDETITIGRLKSNTIVIEDNSISLMHAKITRKDGQFYLKDLNSTNGTTVNGQPIGEVRLRDQDRVRFADIVTLFAVDHELTAVPAAANTATPARAAAPAPLAQPTPSLAAPSLTQPAAPAKAPATPKPKPERKPAVNRRALLAAAAIIIVILPGIGFVVWKSLSSESQSSLMPTTPSAKPKKEIATTPAKQVAPDKPAVEAKAVPEPTETSGNPGLNIPDLVSALNSTDVMERRQAASTLHGAGPDAKEAIPALKQALKDSDGEVQMWAALALVNTQTYDKAIIPILLRALKNDNAVLRQVACLSLGLIPYEGGDKEAVVPALTEAATKDADEQVRKAANSALNIVGAESGTQRAAK